MNGVVRVCIAGASGYTGGELLRLLSNHPHIEVSAVTSREYVGKPVYFVHFNLRGIYRNLKFSSLNVDEFSEKCDTVFLSLPHGVSLSYVPKLVEMGLMVVDLSSDFRLKDPEMYRVWYGYEHPYPDLLKKAVYGLPEIHRDELRSAKLIATPGCNATATLLSLLPLVKGRIGLEKVIVDVKAGSSEAGSRPSLADHHPEREGCIRPYEAEGHRHVAEVEQELSSLAGKRILVSMIPHAVGSVRGVLASSHTWIDGELEELDVLRLYVSTYRNEPFVRVVYSMPPGYPDPKYVVGSNYADVGFAWEKRVRRLTAFAAIDNLVKGAAGQAIQAFNIAAGFEETAGLEAVPLKPI
ncbi:MAG: N-acetyl-gamma-glutamyl-phosphate reductase [Desulfurococcaceae archaeon]